MELERIELSHPEQIWLDALLLKFNRGESPSLRRLIVQLRAKIPADFDPRMMDERLVRSGTELTLYGIWHVDPDSQWLTIVSRVISHIKHVLLVQPDREDFSSDEIAGELELNKEIVNLSLGLLSQLGFVTGADFSDRAQDLNVRVDNERSFRMLVHFQSIENVLQDYVTAYAEQKRAEGVSVRTSSPGHIPERQVRTKADTALVLIWMKGPDDRDSIDVGDVVSSVCSEFGVKSARADEFEQAGRVSDVIIRKMLESEILIADLTDSRPELYYEIGIVHAVGKRPILFHKRGAPLPFQLAGYHVGEYENLAGLTDLLRMRLASMLGVRRMFTK